MRGDPHPVQPQGRLPLLPAAITSLRLLAAPAVVVVSLLGPNTLPLLWLMLGAALTDYLDGWTARRLHRTSFEGKVLDFVADKVFLSVSLLVLTRYGYLDPTISALLVGYHLLVLAATTVVSWGTGRPIVAIPTGEKLVVIFSFVLIISRAGQAALPGKQVYSAVAGITEFLTLSSLAFGVFGYLRLIRRILMRLKR